jgi:hypothetical protein
MGKMAELILNISAMAQKATLIEHVTGAEAQSELEVLYQSLQRLFEKFSGSRLTTWITQDRQR